MKIYCKTCNTAISKEVTLYTGTSFSNADGEPFIQAGYYTFCTDDVFIGHKGDVIINISDLINCSNHTLSGRLNGCCGLDGMDGLNKICINGHEVAIECSDCWMPHAIFFEKDKISLK